MSVDTRLIGCRSDFEVGGFLGDIAIDGFAGLTTLRSDPADLDAKAKRFELIDSVRAGKHLELAVTARTFRQSKGKQNRRYLRLGGDLSAQVPTFAKQPFLVDHNTHEQISRKGTILTSKLVAETHTRDSFEMSFSTVKPDAVISVLDGTLDRFSIGWFALGAVMCTVHGADVRASGSCGCYPGDAVELDGKVRIVEYEFSAWQGKEMSGVNIPAVEHTSIEDIRAALSAELNLHPATRHRSHKEIPMRFTRLAAALALAAQDELDEGRAVDAVEALQRRSLAAETERNTLRAQLTDSQTQVGQLKAALAAASTGIVKVRVDALISAAYRDGKLGYGRDESGNAIPSRKEARLRRIAATPGTGLDELQAELDEMEVIIPVGKRLQADDAVEPERKPFGAPLEFGDNPYIGAVAAQLGLKVEDMIVTAANMNRGALEGGE